MPRPLRPAGLDHQLCPTVREVAEGTMTTCKVRLLSLVVRARISRRLGTIARRYMKDGVISTKHGANQGQTLTMLTDHVFTAKLCLDSTAII
jgi:hypothetical protein